MKLFSSNQRLRNSSCDGGAVPQAGRGASGGASCGLKNRIATTIGPTMAPQWPHKRSGFTLVEMIIYIAMVSIFFVGMVGFFWQMKQAEVRGFLVRELKENMAQSLELVKYTFRNAEEVDFAGSQFDADAGSLELIYSGGDKVFDTYTTSVLNGSVSTTIRKLRYTQPGQSAVDITSDHVSVEKFRLTDLTPSGSPGVVQVELELSTINPSQDALYDNQFALQSTYMIRKEL